VPSKPPDLSAVGMRAVPADPFDLWLSCDLHSRYSATAAEPIPQELLRLLDHLSKTIEARAVEPPTREWEIDMPSTGQGFEQRVRERAYFLWLEEGRSRDRAAEHWRLASAFQVAHEAGED
jgi:hypothetical protein